MLSTSNGAAVKTIVLSRSFTLVVIHLVVCKRAEFIHICLESLLRLALPALECKQNCAPNHRYYNDASILSFYTILKMLP